MTKDEAIDLEAESRAAIKFAEVQFRNEDEFTERDLTMVQAGWLAAKRSITTVPISEAVAWRHTLPVGQTFADGKWGQLLDNFSEAYSEFLLHGGWLEALAVRPVPVANSKCAYCGGAGGWGAGEDAESCTACNSPAAQPAADPAPVPAQGTIDTPEFKFLAEFWAGKYHSSQPMVRQGFREAWASLIAHIDARLNEASGRHSASTNPLILIETDGETTLISASQQATPAAQGIDHAKRAEGERAAFDSFLRGEAPADYAASNADAWHIWQAAWQARGQQAGAPEDCPDIGLMNVVRQNAKRYRWLRGRHVDAGYIEIAGADVWPNGSKAYKRIGGAGEALDRAIDAAMLAAAPGEAG